MNVVDSACHDAFSVLDFASTESIHVACSFIAEPADLDDVSSTLRAVSKLDIKDERMLPWRLPASNSVIDAC